MADLPRDRRLRRLPSFRASTGVFADVWQHEANRHRRVRAIARAILVQARWRILGRSSIVPFASSSKVEVRFDSGASKRVAYASLPDCAEMRAWQNVLRPGDLFVDVGANVGLYTLLACELGCDVIAIEPLTDAADQLEANLRLNGYSARVVRGAVDEQSGMVSLTGPDDQRAHLSESGELVPALTLDELIGNRTVAGLKVDVEGAERRVLAGACRALRDHRITMMQLEWNDRAMVNFGESRDDSSELLLSSGYEFLRPDSAGRLATSEPEIGRDLFARSLEAGTDT